MQFKPSFNFILGTLGFVLLLSCWVFAFFFHSLGGNNYLLIIYALLFSGAVLVIVDNTQKPGTLKGKRPLIYLMLVYILWLVLEPYVSTWFGVSRLTSWVLVLTPLSFLICSYLDIDHLKQRLALVTYFSFGTLLFFWGLLHFLATQQQPEGPLNDANVYAGLLLFFLLPVVMYLLLNQRHSEKQKRLNGYLYLYVFFGFSAFFTVNSRSASIAFVVVMACLLLKMWRDFKWQHLKNLIVLAAVILASSVFSVSIIGQKQQRNYLDLANDNGFQYRLMMWETSWEVYKEHPVTGIGFGQFRHFYRQHRNPEDINSAGNFAHNDYLQFLLEGGVIQAIFIACLALYIIYLFLRRFFLKTTGSHFAQMQVFLAICLCCVFFLQALVNFIFYVPVCAITLGCVLAYINRNIEDVPAAEPGSQSINLGTKTLLASGLVSMFALSTLLADSYVYAHYRVMPNNQDADTAAEMYASSQSLVGFRPRIIVLRRYRFLYALQQLKSLATPDVAPGDLDEVELNLREVLRLDRTDAISLQFLADLAQNHTSLMQALREQYPQQALYQQSAIELYEASLDSDPTLIANYFRLHDIYKQTQGREVAYNFLKNSFETRISFGEFSLVQKFRVYEVLLDDALALNKRADAETYARLVIKVDTCNQSALTLFGLEKPGNCP